MVLSTNLKRAACSHLPLFALLHIWDYYCYYFGGGGVEATSESSSSNLVRAGPRGERTFFFRSYVSVGANRVPRRDMIAHTVLIAHAGVGQR